MEGLRKYTSHANTLPEKNSTLNQSKTTGQELKIRD